jgi:Lytic transglycolase
VALLKRKAENPVAALERELSDLTARRAALEVKLTDAAGALAVAVDERRRRRSSNRSNGKSAVVTINDRGPFVRGRVIDLTPCCSPSMTCVSTPGCPLIEVNRPSMLQRGNFGF